MLQQVGKDIGLFLTLTKNCLETTRCQETAIQLNIVDAQCSLFLHRLYMCVNWTPTTCTYAYATCLKSYMYL